MDLITGILTPEEYDAWDAFVYSTRNGSIFSTAEYLDEFCSAAGGTFRIAAVKQDGKLIGGIAFYRQESRWGPVSGPRLLFPYNGLVYAESDSTYPSRKESLELKVQSALAECIEHERFASIMVKCRSPIQDIRVFMERGWEIRPTYTFVVDFSNLEAQWGRVDRNLKRLIKRCDAGEFAFTDDRDFESFYRLHLAVHDRKGAPVYLPAGKFRTWFLALADKGLARLFQARTSEGEAVAAQIVLTGNHKLSHTISAGSDERFSKFGVNAFLRWKAFEKLHELGYEQNDLTDASLNSVSRFKSQLGGELKMSFALNPPPTRLYRAGSAVENFARRIKGSIGGA